MRGRRVSTLSEISRGDHIKWRRGRVLYTHHAIVTDINPSEKKTLRVVHYSDPERDGNSLKSAARATIIEEWVEAFQDDLFIVEYEKDTNDPDDVIERARSRCGENTYKLIFNNCESFATWCKIGKNTSFQVVRGVAVVGTTTTVPSASVLGAVFGTAILPGIGTAVGAGAGGVIGFVLNIPAIVHAALVAKR